MTCRLAGPTDWKGQLLPGETLGGPEGAHERKFLLGGAGGCRAPAQYPSHWGYSHMLQRQPFEMVCFW